MINDSSIIRVCRFQHQIFKIYFNVQIARRLGSYIYQRKKFVLSAQT